MKSNQIGISVWFAILMLLFFLLGAFVVQSARCQMLNAPPSAPKEVTIAQKIPGNNSQSYAIWGQITDDQANPLPDYTVETTSSLDGISYAIRTNSSGKFRLSNLHEGDWLLHVKADSMLLKAQAITLSKDVESEVNFTLQGTGRVSGFLLDSASKTPLPIDGTVSLGLRVKSGRRVVRTFQGQAHGGSFEVGNLLPGRYVVIDAFFGYVLDMQEAPEVIVSPDSHVGGIELFLKPGASIFGRLVDEEMAPVPDLEIKIASDKIKTVGPSRSAAHKARTTVDGTFQLTIPNDPDIYYAFTVMIMDPRYQGRAFFKKELIPGQREYDLGDLVMRKVLRLEGEISDPTRSVEGLRVQLRRHDKRGDFFRLAARWQIEVFTDSEGRFVLDELYPIGYSLAILRGNVTVAYLGSVNPQEKGEIKIRLEPLQTLRGRVADEQQQPIPDAQVRADAFPTQDGAHQMRLATTQTDSDGRFQLGVLKSGSARVRVKASKNGYLSSTYPNVHITAEELIVPLRKGATLKGHFLTPPGLSTTGNNVVKLFAEEMKPDPIINPYLLRKPIWSESFPSSQTSFIINGLPEAKYQLYIVSNGVGATGTSIDLASSSGLVIVVATQPTVNLQAQVLWADTHEPVINADVSRAWYPWELETG